MQFYCGRMFNFLRFRGSENSVIFDMLPSYRERVKSGETIDAIYNEIMANPKEHVEAVKKNGITNLLTICGYNGAGKSSILESITYALYGCVVRQAINVTNESVYDYITRINGHYPAGLREAWVEWLFEEKGKIYIVQRGANISGKSRTPLLNFWDVTSGDRISLSGHRTKETGEAILKVIGYDYDVFSSSIMFGQNDAGKFLVGKDKDRKEMIVKILHLEDVVSGCLDIVRESKKEIEKEIKQLNIKSDLIVQRIVSRPTIDEINKKIVDIRKISDNCDTETKKNNDEIEMLSKSDILKEFDLLRVEGLKVKSDIASKKKDLVNQTKEWNDVLNSAIESINKKSKEIVDNNVLLQRLKFRADSLDVTIKSFNLEKEKKDLETVEKAKIVKPAITKQYEDLIVKESKFASDMAVEDANIQRLIPELGSLKKQLQSAGEKDKFICDKCKSVVSKEHIEGEVNRTLAIIEASRSKKGKYSRGIEVLRKECLEIKDKKEKVEKWLVREGQIKASIQKNESDKALLFDLANQIVETKSTTARLSLELKLFETQKQDCYNRINSIASKCQDEIKVLEARLNEIREKYLKADVDSKSVKTKIEELRKKNEIVSNNKSSYSSQIGSMQKEIENIEGETKSLKEVKALLEEKTKEFQRYIFLDDIFGLEGIQTRIVNKYLPALNRYIEEFLAVLTNGDMNVKISTNTASAIDIDIKGSTGNSYNMISGGEKNMLRLGGSIGLSLLSFVRTAQKPEMICLDEIFGPLDEIRRSAVFQLLSKLQSRFSRIVVISHNADINENIPNRILVEKTDGYNGVSKIIEIV